MSRLFIVALCAAFMTACASTPNPIAAETRSGTYVTGADLVWSVDDADEQDDNGNYAAGRDDLLARLEAAVETEFAHSPAGSQPVSFSIDIQRYNRVNALTGNIIGGSNMVIADVSVIDENGNVLGVYEDVTGYHASGAGIIGAIAQAAIQPDIVGIMSNSFVADLRRRFDRD
ncbi:hypothetical protein [Maricaulis salignorans]|uniref:DUF4410 domain-containing protein n=1 Tax=Maricaulis salignorans TaxID=144026 RepID=A0A1G9PVN1_9PROT|nr:hypothetical protein [Maricaulis salignorans]SDM02165.1 hypothetical protein SAMN04488568_10429 [Maricaulis salignorans]